MVSMESLAHTQDNMTALAFFDMHISSVTCLVIVCLLVLMGLVTYILNANVRKYLQGPKMEVLD